MAAFDLDAIMDAIATTLMSAPAVTPRAYAWPSPDATPPCAVVGYPKSITFDMTFGRGADEAVFPVWFITGNSSDRAARKVLSDIITGATGIKNKLDGNLGGAVQTARVTDCEIEAVNIGGAEYIAARFDLEVVS